MHATCSILFSCLGSIMTKSCIKFCSDQINSVFDKSGWDRQIEVQMDREKYNIDEGINDGMWR